MAARSRLPVAFLIGLGASGCGGDEVLAPAGRTEEIVAGGATVRVDTAALTPSLTLSAKM